jgi:ribosomal protein S6
MDEDKEKKLYELALLLRAEEDLANVLAFVRAHEAEVVSEPRSKKLLLAYPIKGSDEALFASCMFQASGESAKRIERDLVTNAFVIRSMIMIATPPSERPVAVPPRPGERRPYASAVRTPSADAKPAAPRPLTNDALEKKIEEILG